MVTAVKMTKKMMMSVMTLIKIGKVNMMMMMMTWGQ